MKKIAFFFLSFALSSLLTAQVERYAPIIGGTETGGKIFIPAADSPIDFPKYWVLRFAPHIDFNIYKRLYLGFQVEYTFGQVEDVKLTPQKGAGVRLKYYFQNNNRNRFVRNRFMPYTEVSWNLLNYIFDGKKEYGFEPLQNFSNHNVQGLLGVNFRLFDHFYLDYALRGMYYSKNDRLLLANRVGLQYHFGERRKFAPKTEPIKILDPVNQNKADKLNLFDFRYFLKRTTVQTRYSFIFDSGETGEYFYYKQNSLSLALITSISSDIYFGLMYQPIWTKVGTQDPQQYFMAGPFLQYDVIRNPNKERFFVEFGFFKGNLCTCGETTSYKKENLSYIPIGVGYEKRINHTNFYWGLSAQFYRILTDASEMPGTYAHPTVSITYKLSDDL